MSDYKIQLPDFLIADLYKQSLVEINDKILSAATENVESNEANVAEGPNTEVKYLGGNKKNIIMVVNVSDSRFVAEQDLQFLTNVLKACSLTIEDISVINLAYDPVVFTYLKEQLSAAHIFLYDIEPTVIKVPFVAPHFQVQKFDGTTVVSLPTLSEMNLPTEESVQLKRNLWTCLKKVFNI